MKHINTALKSLIEKAGLKKQLEQQRVLEMWGQIVGDAIAKNTEAVSVNQGTLVIKAKSAAFEYLYKLTEFLAMMFFLLQTFLISPERW